jgi:tRNA(Ile)-lysidine synthase TilS/MesJ
LSCSGSWPYQLSSFLAFRPYSLPADLTVNTNKPYNSSKTMKICQQCILPESFPGIKFDDKGICNHCRRADSSAIDTYEQKSKYRDNLDKLIAEIRGVAPSYDVIIAYSGGKDSSYTLKLLRERFNLRILALTFDNHFVSPVAWQNIRGITDVLEVDHISFKLPWPTAKAIFSTTAKEDIFSAPTLLRASSVCTACIGMVKSLVLKTALEMSIPMAAFGWSPGQAPIQSAIMKTNASLARQTQSSLKKAFSSDLIKGMNQYFIPDAYYENYKERFPYNIHPLAFFDYDEEDVIKQIKTLGWKEPKDTDTNSSNCLLNAFANQCHLKRHGFNPYVWEIAGMVRQGVMGRNEGIEKIYTEQNQDMVNYAKERLGL